MSQQRDNAYGTYLAGEAIGAFIRVKLSGSTSRTIAIAGAGEKGIGITQEAVASGGQVTVKEWSAPGTQKVTAADGIVCNAMLYPAAAGKFSDSGTGNGDPVLYALETGSGAGAVIEALTLPAVWSIAAFATMPTIPAAAVAATGNSQGTAAAIATGFTHVTAADGTKGAKLPACAAGKVCIVKNSDAANAVLKLYPDTDDAINAIAANSALSMAAKTACILVGLDGTTWYTIPLLPS